MSTETDQNAKRITFVTAEMAPFAKVGGLGDVAGSLPAALASRGHSVYVYMPLYKDIDLAAHGIRSAHRNEAGWVDMGGEQIPFQMFALGKTGKRNLHIRFIANNRFFGEKGIYSREESGEPFAEGFNRYVFFQKSIIRRLEMAEEKPDIVHCNDYHTALLPYFLKVHSTPAMQKIATVLSVHNLAYQGETDETLLDVAGIPRELFYPMSPFEFYGKVNQMKAGLHFADKITTVSPTYAREIQSDPERGAGLEGVLADRSDDLVGILNGIDTRAWDPRRDELIEKQYGITSLGGKAANKRALQKETGLKVTKKRTPLLGMVSRLVDQKGLDILIPALRNVLTDEMQVVILGSGEKRYHDELKKLQSEFPGKMAVVIGYDNRLSHLVEAGSDIYLMPSRYEPCGLNQFFSLRYGTIPIVHETGGLKDTIEDVERVPEGGNGFSFSTFTEAALTETIGRAIARFNDKAAWETLMKRAMKGDFSWGQSAAEYEQLYQQAIQKKNEAENV